MSPRVHSASLWEGLRAWLDGGGVPSPSLAEWEGELSELRDAWRDEERHDDLRGLELLRRATRLTLLLDDVGPTSPALVPRRGRDPRRALEGAFGVPDLERLLELVEGAAHAPPALRARVHDLRWLLLGDRDSARQAREAYLEVARSADLGRASQAVAAGEALLRAVLLGMDHADPVGVDAALSELLPSALYSEHPVALHRFLQAALSIATPNRSALADLAIARAESEIARRDFRWGRVFYGHAERALAGARCIDEAQTLSIVRASVLGDEARFRRGVDHPAWIARSFARRAVEELRPLAAGSELLAELEREAGLKNGRANGHHATHASNGAHAANGSHGTECDDGRFAAVLEEVQHALDELDPHLAAQLIAALPLEPEQGVHTPVGPAVLEQFLRRFRARARGRFHALPSEGGARASDSAHVRAWVQSARDWLVPLLDALRRNDARGPTVRRASLRQLFSESSVEVARRNDVLVEGAAACWEGDRARGLGLLVPELAVLRASAPVHRLLDRSPPLALVDAALLHHPDGFALAAWVDHGDAARARHDQGAADLLLWWTLCLASLVEA